MSDTTIAHERPSQRANMTRAIQIVERLKPTHSGADVQFVCEQLEHVARYARMPSPLPTPEPGGAALDKIADALRAAGYWVLPLDDGSGGLGIGGGSLPNNTNKAGAIGGVSRLPTPDLTPLEALAKEWIANNAQNQDMRWAFRCCGLRLRDVLAQMKGQS